MESTERSFLVVNPASANGATGKRWMALEAGLRRALPNLDKAFTREPLEAERLTRQALKDGYRRIIAVGGDGTINEVVNGFFDESHRPISADAQLAVIPQGTGGDFRRTFGWEDELSLSARRAAEGPVRKLDVGRLEYTRHDGTRATRLFINVCSFGVSGLVDREVNKGSKWLGGKATFYLGSFKAMMQYSDKPVRLSFDGQPAQTQTVTTLAVANGRYFGGGMCVAPQADPSDGQFDVTVWSGFGLKDFVVHSKAIYDGTHTRLDGTRTLRCSRVEASSDEEVLLDVDGEQPGRLPCSLSLLPSVLSVRV
jgi:YegS/Rv2252/BmrU family lipid kinase